MLEAPSWSPDGRLIVFSEGLERPMLKIVSAAGGRARTIGEGSAPSWSRSRNLIVFDSGALVVANPSGGGRREVVQSGSNPAWSPGGRSLAFVRTEGCDHDCWYGIAVVRLGYGIRKLPLAALPETPAWSPDGTRLVYVTDIGELALVRPSGRGARILVDGPGSQSEPDWKP